MWFLRALSWLGVLYEVIRCIMCGVEAVIRKGRGELPPGWSCKTPAGRATQYFCPGCGPT